MKTIKTSELTGAALDWVVAKCEGLDVGAVSARKAAHRMAWENASAPPLKEPDLTEYLNRFWANVFIDESGDRRAMPKYSVNWAISGLIIERELLCITPDVQGARWMASMNSADLIRFGLTPLISAMRCYVASKLGDEIEIPEELI